MSRTRITIKREAPPPYCNRSGWLAEQKHGQYWLIDLEGGGQTVLHRDHFDIVEPEAETPPATATVMVGHCAVTVPASTVAWKATSIPFASIDTRTGLVTGHIHQRSAPMWHGFAPGFVPPPGMNDEIGTGPLEDSSGPIAVFASAGPVFDFAPGHETEGGATD